MKPARLRPLAEDDLVERTQYFRREAGDEVAHRFFDTAIAALRAIEQMPGAGTPRIRELSGVAGLRFRRVEEFPCGWCYLIRTDYVDVVRLLADSQNHPALLDHLHEP